MSAPSRVVVRNPARGDGDGAARARRIAFQRDWEVLDSEGGEHTAPLAAEAADRVDTVVACGGDDTLAKAVAGVQRADRLDDVSVGFIPTCEGSDFADAVGIRGVEHAFEVIETGRCRLLDLGTANGRPFLTACVGGLTAEATARTTTKLERRLGVLAHVLTALSASQPVERPTLQVAIGPRRDPVWRGEAAMVLTGNACSFPGQQLGQADMEDGLFNVVVIEEVPSLNYLSRGAADRLLRRQAPHLTRLRAQELRVTHPGSPVQCDLDGEPFTASRIAIDSRPGALAFHVGPDYDPNPSVRG